MSLHRAMSFRTAILIDRSGVDFDDAESGYKEEDKDTHKVEYPLLGDDVD